MTRPCINFSFLLIVVFRRLRRGKTSRTKHFPAISFENVLENLHKFRYIEEWKNIERFFV